MMWYFLAGAVAGVVTLKFFPAIDKKVENIVSNIREQFGKDNGGNSSS